MELADRVFQTVIRSLDANRYTLDVLQNKDELAYWRRVLRMAALLHDVGHLPFSHAAEKDLLPHGWSHERLTGEIITSDMMTELFLKLTPPIRSEDVAKIALGPKKWPGSFNVWESILAEIITGDALGVDRMDYLLRDSHHAGVAYGRFDHFRLIDTIRVLPSPADSDEETVTEPMLGVEEGGLHSAEALLLARYFMYTQVYFHPVRRAYDIHLKDFLKEWLPEGTFSTDLEKHLSITDNEVTVGILKASRDKNSPGHDPAYRITARQHYKLIYERDPEDYQHCPDPGEKIAAALKQQFGEDAIRHDTYIPSGSLADFPVLRRDGSVTSALFLSDVLRNIPPAAFDYVFVRPDLRDRAQEYVKKNKASILES